MAWVKLTEPAALAVNFDDLKNHLRLTDSNEDDLLLAYANAAVDIVELKTSRALINRTVRYEAERFCDDEVTLPVAPVVSVQTVKYYDTSGTLTTWGSTNYNVDTTNILGRVSPTLGNVFPPTEFNRPNAVQIDYTAGYGATADSVPAGLRMIVLFLAGHFFINRAPMVVGAGSAMEIPATLGYALDAYKIWRA